MPTTKCSHCNKEKVTFEGKWCSVKCKTARAKTRPKTAPKNPKKN